MTSGPKRAVGVRALAKAERRRRLKAAAIAVFSEKGYDAATTREIASRAKLGAATLFRYAEQKRDLLLMIVNDDLQEIDAVALAKASTEMPLIEGLLALFVPRLRYWSKNLALARANLYETVLARAGDATFEVRRYAVRRRAMLSAIGELVQHQQEHGLIRSDEEAKLLAEFLLGVYLAHLRLWLSQAKPGVPEGIHRLRLLLTLAIEGISAKRAQGIKSQPASDR